jgi:hypothetical protein
VRFRLVEKTIVFGAVRFRLPVKTFVFTGKHFRSAVKTVFAGKYEKSLIANKAPQCATQRKIGNEQ